MRHWRSGLITEYEYTLKFISVASHWPEYLPEQLSSTSPELNLEELRQLIDCASNHSDKGSFRDISSFTIPCGAFDEEGIWEEKERAVRPGFDKVVKWLVKQLESEKNGAQPQS